MNKFPVHPTLPALECDDFMLPGAPPALRRASGATLRQFQTSAQARGVHLLSRMRHGC
ncbi:MAG: hypothetical protein IAE85_05485 [Anaerolinea sp.]|nr:hypothetical protein [Anaerolinea sp.]